MLTMLGQNELRLGKTVIGKPVISMTETGSTITVEIAGKITDAEVKALLDRCFMAVPTGHQMTVKTKQRKRISVLKVEYASFKRSSGKYPSSSLDDDTHARLRLASEALVERIGR